MLSNYIDGRFAQAPDAAPIFVLNPARGTVIAQIPDSPKATVEEAIESANKLLDEKHHD